MVDNGKKAVEACKIKDYDAILMDCHMPKMNGYNATKEIRDIEKSNQTRTPIIAMTADAMIGTRDMCLEAGMDEYISKPIDVAVFKEILSQWFIFENSASETQKTENKKESTKLINLDVLNAYTDGDEEQNKELLQTFYSKSLEDIKNLSDYIIEGKSNEWSYHAHSLKGAAAYIGADILYNLSEKAQNLVETSKTEREDLFNRIETSHKAVCEHLINHNLLSI